MDTLLLSIVTFVPAMAALILLVVARGEDAAAGLVAKRFALVATTATFIISLFILWQFDPSDTSFQMVEEADWLLGLKYKLGGTASALEAVYSWKSVQDFERFMRFAQRYAEANGLGYTQNQNSDQTDGDANAEA